MRKYLLYTLIIFLTVPSLTSFSQRKSYSILLAGKKIGSIEALKTTSGNDDFFNVTSEVDFKVLWRKYNRKTRNIIKMQNGQVVESRSGIYMNHTLEDSSFFQKKDLKFNYYKFPDQKFNSNFFSIENPSMNLYFNEPKGIKQIYSERFLEYCNIEPKGTNKYIIYLPNGKENIYTYEKGELIEVFVDRTWFNLTFKAE